MSIEKYSLAQDIFHFTSLHFLINLGHKLIQFPKKTYHLKKIVKCCANICKKGEKPNYSQRIHNRKAVRNLKSEQLNSVKFDQN